MEKKIYKPSCCRACPAFNAKKMRCGCIVREKNKEKIDETLQYKNCPLAWDKPEENNNADTTRFLKKVLKEQL